MCMNPISELRKEHIAIERELFELDSIMEDEVINYSNLVHTFRKLCEIWDKHEEEEDGIFAVMKRERIVVPVYTMTCEHRDIRGYANRFKDAINSGSDFKVKKCFDKDLKVLIAKVREHINMEDEVLYRIALDEFSEEELEEMARMIREGDSPTP